MGLIQRCLSILSVFDSDRQRRERVDMLGGELLLQFGRLPFGEELLPGKRFGAFQRGEGLGRPVSLKVWSTVRSPRLGPRRRR